MTMQLIKTKLYDLKKAAGTVWLAWLWVVLWMGLIFFFSSQPGKESAELSQGISQILINLVTRVSPDLNVDWQAFHLLIRKNAHFFVYLILGILVLRALLKTKPFSIRTGITALLICFIYAVTDEFHQLFVPGRSGQVSDVIIDTFGAAAGLALYSAFLHLKQRRAKRRQDHRQFN